MRDQRAKGRSAKMLIESVEAPPVWDAIWSVFVEAASAGPVAVAPVSASPVADGTVVLKS